MTCGYQLRPCDGPLRLILHLNLFASETILHILITLHSKILKVLLLHTSCTACARWRAFALVNCAAPPPCSEKVPVCFPLTSGLALLWCARQPVQKTLSWFHVRELEPLASCDLYCAFPAIIFKFCTCKNGCERMCATVKKKERKKMLSMLKKWAISTYWYPDSSLVWTESETQTLIHACMYNGFSFSFICCNWKIIQAMSGGIDKELMKRGKESLKAIKRERLWWRWHHGATRRRQALLLLSVCVCECGGVCVCVCLRQKEGILHMAEYFCHIQSFLLKQKLHVCNLS